MGALVFGGGHVVLPLLNSELVSTGLINQDLFMAGYGATQAVPGPLFTFSAYLGASITAFNNNIWIGGFICLSALVRTLVGAHRATVNIASTWN